jgi:hypothetical protein
LIARLDGIPFKLFTLILPLILPFITHIFNTVLPTSGLPKILEDFKGNAYCFSKEPIHTSRLSSYKYLALTLKSLMKDQILAFVNHNDLLNRFQSSFYSAHSTISTLLNVTNNFCRASKRRFATVLLLLGFTKAFNRVIHDLLCNKLSSIFKFNPTAVSLLKSSLSTNQLSCLAPILKGSYARLHTGPHTFLSFINDLMSDLISLVPSKN